VIKKYLEMVRDSVSPENLMTELKNLYETDRFYTFPKFRETAEYIEKRMSSQGCRVTMHSHAADGRTKHLDWTMPLAWDVDECLLEITEPSDFSPKKLADRKETLQCAVFGSGFTPENGTEAEMVFYEKEKKRDDFKSDMFQNKIVFTQQRANMIKKEVAAAGGLGVVSCYIPDPEHFPDVTFWTNTWHDTGWAITETCSKIFGISITPSKGKRLISAFNNGSRLRARAKVTGRYYKGEFFTPVSEIPGKYPQTILGYAHIYEQGAQDNASGGAALLEIARIIQSLLENGTLRELKRTVRFLHCFECYGTVAYTATADPQEIELTRLGIYLDTIGLDQARDTKGTFKIVNDPHPTSTFAQILSKRLVESRLPDSIYRKYVSFTLGDNWITDPLVDIPGVWLEMESDKWHSSADTIDTMDPETFRIQTEIAAAYILFAAQAGPEEAEWLAEEIVMESEQDLACGDRGKLEYLCMIRKRQLDSLNRILTSEEAALFRPVLEEKKRTIAERVLQSSSQPEDSWKDVRSQIEDIGQCETVFPKSLMPGQYTFEDIPEDEKKGIPGAVWSSQLITAAYWADGTRSIADIIKYIYYEYGTLRKDLLKYFTFLEKHGYAEFK